MPVMQAGTDADGRKPSSVLSSSTILILSGYLLGVVSGQLPGTGLRGTAVTAGLFGIVAWSGLALDTRRRKRRDAESRRRRTATRLEIRIDRHIPRQFLVRRPRRPVPRHEGRGFGVQRGTAESYLPVVGGSGWGRRR